MNARFFIGGLAPRLAWGAHDLPAYWSRARDLKRAAAWVSRARALTGPALGPWPVP